MEALEGKMDIIDQKLSATVRDEREEAFVMLRARGSPAARQSMLLLIQPTLNPTEAAACFQARDSPCPPPSPPTA